MITSLIHIQVVQLGWENHLLLQLSLTVKCFTVWFSRLNWEYPSAIHASLVSLHFVIFGTGFLD